MKVLETTKTVGCSSRGVNTRDQEISHTAWCSRMTDRGQYTMRQRRAKEGCSGRKTTKMRRRRRKEDQADRDAAQEQQYRERAGAAEAPDEPGASKRSRKPSWQMKRRLISSKAADKPKGNAAGTGMPGLPAGIQTFEVFGIVGGRLAPMTSAITNSGGRWTVESWRLP